MLKVPPISDHGNVLRDRRLLRWGRAAAPRRHGLQTCSMPHKGEGFMASRDNAHQQLELVSARKDGTAYAQTENRTSRSPRLSPSEPRSSRRATSCARTRGSMATWTACPCSPGSCSSSSSMTWKTSARRGGRSRREALSAGHRAALSLARLGGAGRRHHRR